MQLSVLSWSETEPLCPKHFWSVFRSEEKLKPSRFVLEEDEGFSDWSHRLENRHETEEQENCRAKEHKTTAASESKHEDEEEGRGEDGGRSSEEDSTRLSEKVCSL